MISIWTIAVIIIYEYMNISKIIIITIRIRIITHCYSNIQQYNNTHLKILIITWDVVAVVLDVHLVQATLRR